MPLKPIPSPPAYPLLGHAGTGVVDPTNSARSFALLRAKYGPIYTLNFFGRTIVLVSSQRLVNELCDESRFHKKVEAGVLEVVRNGAGDGLFTAYDGEENWGIAHRILMPAFGPSQILSMFPQMLDLNSQLLLKWERFGPDTPFDPAEDFTRLAFDTVALCVMNYRFNSFYEREMPPFIGAMGRFLVESGMRVQRPKVVQSWMKETNRQYEADIKLMVDVCDQIVAHRKQHPLPEGQKDLLSLMLSGQDSKTGRSLTDANIRNQLITFLIAGHETTSGLLSFTLYHLLSNPRAYAALQKEVDTVLGKEAINVHHLPKLEYANAVLRESIRLNPPAGAITVSPVQPTEVLGGKYEVRHGWNLLIDLNGLQRDPEVWGEDADEFKPERMLGGKFEQLPPNSWKPFGNGARACIGRPLAWQEAIMMLATLFQRFDIRFDDPGYHLQIKQTLTTKPKDFKIHAIPRQGARVVGPGVSAAEPEAATVQHVQIPTVDLKGKGTPLHIYFGSNTGSCEGFSQQVASDASAHGFLATLATLDSVEDPSKLPRDGPVLVLCASYEGQPADNAAHFVQALVDLSPANAPLKGVKYAVFGAGNHDWARTFQRIPTLVDARLEELGGERLAPRGVGDAGGADLFGEFDAWEKAVWPVLGKAFDTLSPPGSPRTEEEEDLVVTVAGMARTIRLRQPYLSQGICVENRVLTAPGVPEKRHLEFRLPPEISYRPGDYLAILPLNPPETVRRVLKHFQLLAETKVAIKSKGPTTLPTDEPISLQELFSEYVELSQPMTQRNLDDVLRFAPREGEERAALDKVVANAKVEIFDKHLSVLDLLEKFPCINVPLGHFIKLLPGMRIRQYSISSSPLWKPDHCTLTFSVLRELSRAGEGEFVGVASNYLAALKPGDTVALAVRPSAVNFHLPADSSKPVVMFCAGSGFAPMRGFIQDRAEQIAAGRTVGKALLFVGCRGPEEDFLYADRELAGWIECGAVDVRPAFSRHPELSEGCKHVQDRVWNDRTDIFPLYDAGAKFFSCGMSGMSQGVRGKCIQMIQERTNWGEEKSEERFQKISIERYSTDVFG
ncbi:cytochrome P450 [Dacryopinax primogenitus]|uniref:Cytochrome P450 n=1 Tax=Dacryopinax primogenitus (strain DJM 731) TaxID=1858805 RepID=M5GGB8_DACPD|nr:cytochrome P450 [Dacryopinax primogenitus]EJU05213.1 cytochrome P450 [Dacryopinax primogenitus]